jgi:hypothetical protein
MTTQSVSVRRTGTDDGPTLARLRRLWADEDGRVEDPSFDERFADWFGREPSTASPGSPSDRGGPSA